jgi:hypothetical protein
LIPQTSLEGAATSTEGFFRVNARGKTLPRDKETGEPAILTRLKQDAAEKMRRIEIFASFPGDVQKERSLAERLIRSVAPSSRFRSVSPIQTGYAH